MSRFGRVFVCLLLFLSLWTSPDSTAQMIDMDTARAREEFRWGVEAYHAARFNDAIVAFNRALALTPEDFLVREWLGRAYYRSGFEDAALNEWDMVVANDAAGAYLISRQDILRYRRGIQPFRDEAPQFSRSRILRGEPGDGLRFHRPTGLSADSSGDIYLVSLGTQEVLQITPNGRVRRSLRGGLQGLDRPFDVVWHAGELFVTEFGGNRVAVLNSQGNRLRHIGERGLGDGQMVGPQYLAIDDEGRIYVTDWGGRRVLVFTSEGEFILAFGRETADFSGMQRPTGIAVDRGRVYVADRDQRGVVLQVFDTAGNFLNRIPLPLADEDTPVNSVTRVVVEGLSWYRENQLLIAAGRRAILFDVTEQRVVAGIDDAERVRVTATTLDANGRILVSDVDAGELGIYEPEGTLYSGLDVWIERILVRQFPTIALQVAVHDRDGRPLVGLTEENFILSEQAIPVENFRIESTGQAVRDLDVAAIVQPRPGQGYRDDVAQAVTDLVGLIPTSDRLQVFVAGAEPAEVIRRPASAERFAVATRNAVESRVSDYDAGNVALDRAIRLAAATLVDRGMRRHMVLFGDGTTTDGAFREYGIQETAAYLHANGIMFHVVLLEPGSPDAELRFLTEETGGEIRYLYEPEGLTPLVERFRAHSSGRYWLSYTTDRFPDFGRAYFPLSLEARLFVRSGRDELGFFPPPEP